MTIEEKYNIVYVDGRRFYKFDMMESVPALEDTNPFLFRYQDIEIRNNNWNKITIEILKEIDRLHPKSEEELLKLSYPFSKQIVFSKDENVNFSKFKGLYLNTNHTATHAMMNIQFLLKNYGIDMSSCYFLIRKHYNVEPEEAKTYFRNKNINEFTKSLKVSGLKDEQINTIIKNIDIVNRHFLIKVTRSLNDFFLFDDYNIFSLYKAKTMSEVLKKYYDTDKNYLVIANCLDRYDLYLKNKELFNFLSEKQLNKGLVSEADHEIQNLLTNADNKVIHIRKLYGRMSVLYPNSLRLLEKFNNVDGLFNYCSILLKRRYYFDYPFISAEHQVNLTTESLIKGYINSLEEVTIDMIKKYIEEKHFKKVPSYLDLMYSLSDNFVQVSVDTFVSREKIVIDDSILETLSYELNYYINSFGPINSDTYNGYSNLPKIGNLEWNKFLLIGIIQSYFQKKYIIEIKNIKFSSLSYLIKKSDK